MHQQYNRLSREGQPFALLRECPKREILLAVSVLIVLLQRGLRGRTELMRRLSENYIRPVHRFLAVLTGRLRFSVAEVLILAATAALIVWLACSIVSLLRKPQKGRRLWRMLMTLASFGFAVYAGFCILWGVYYYGDDFQEKSGLNTREISVEELETVTVYFAARANEYSDLVTRDDEGLYVTDRRAIMDRTPELYRKAEELYPALEGPEVPVKPFFFSKILSLTDFAGFFFPFTAEANVNTDFPPSLFPATAAHELAHQRGVAKEQEANFCAVLASLLDGDPEFCYSACLLAYTHLGNALRSVDPDAFELVYDGLDENVLRDFAANRAYWKQFETPVQEISNTVYEGFLYSYDQDLGLKSYGACVDLLVCHYLEDARQYFGLSGTDGE